VPAAILTDDRRRDVRILHEAGHRTPAIAAAFGVRPRTVRSIVSEGQEATEREIDAAREAHRVLAEGRGERITSTKAERDAFLDEIFGGPDTPGFELNR
jgi:hypothetical protein